MKNLVIGLFVFGLTSLGFSQNINRGNEEVQLEDVAISNVNNNYLEKVQDIELPVSVTSLEKEASFFDVKRLVQFDGRKELYKVKFKGTKGYIIADYDSNGKIIKASERFKDIALPKNLIKTVLKHYPECHFLKVAYSVDYEDQKAVEKTFKIKIMNDGKKRTLKINSGGNFNTALATISIK